MKRICLLLLVMVIFLLAGCGGKEAVSVVGSDTAVQTDPTDPGTTVSTDPAIPDFPGSQAESPGEIGTWISGEKIMTEKEYPLNDHRDKIKIYGRSVRTNDGIACDYSASGIEFNAILKGDLTITVNSSSTSYYTLYLNGKRQENRLAFTSGTSTYTIATELPKGIYQIKLIKQSHILHSTSLLMKISMSGELLARPADKSLLIEFVGDSITCGYGLVGYPTEGVTSYGGSLNTDATLAYAYRTAESLGVDHSLVAVSGWAILPQADGKGSIPRIYMKTSFQRSEEIYTPSRTADIVVIHLGTNDLYSRTDKYESEFVPAAMDFVAQVRKMNPGSKIVWLYGSMMKGTNLTNFENKVNDIVGGCGGSAAGIYALKVPTDTTGGNSHPNVEGQKQTAEILTAFLRENILPAIPEKEPTNHGSETVMTLPSVITMQTGISEDGTQAVRFVVGGLDDYFAVGMEIDAVLAHDSFRFHCESEQTVAGLTAFEGLAAVTAKEADCSWLFGYTITDIPAKAGIGFTVRPYAIVDGQKIYGDSKSFTVGDSLVNMEENGVPINISFPEFGFN